jgi:hypothetical protein
MTTTMTSAMTGAMTGARFTRRRIAAPGADTLTP